MELKQVKTGKTLSLHVKTKMTGLLSRLSEKKAPGNVSYTKKTL